MMFRISKVLSIVSFFIATTFLFDSCKKDTTCVGEIHCVDLNNGTVMPFAKVKIFLDPKYVGFYPCEGGQVLEKNLTADASGKATFCLKLAATPSILATLDITSGGVTTTKTGTGVIATEVGKTVSVTVKMK